MRRSLPVANQGAPTAPRAVTLKEAKPFDGSVLNVSWTAPASSGAGAVAAYRVFVDGKLKASPAGTSATVKNAGPGKHTVKVAAVNAAGTSVTGADTIKLAALSKPRKLEAAAREGRRPFDGHPGVEGAGRRGRLHPEEVRGRDLQGQTARWTPRS